MIFNLITEEAKTSKVAELKVVIDEADDLVISANGISIIALQTDGTLHKFFLSRSEREELSELGFVIDTENEIKTS